MTDRLDEGFDAEWFSGDWLTWDEDIDVPLRENLQFGLVKGFHPEGPLDGTTGRRPDEL